MSWPSEEDRAPDTTSALRILLAWRIIEIRRASSDLLRDPAALLAVAALLIGVVAVTRVGFTHEPNVALARFAAETAASALVFGFTTWLASALQAQGALRGVFFPLVVAHRRRLIFRLFEATGLWFCGLMCAALALVSVAPAHLAGFAAAAGLGLLLTMGFHWWRSPHENLYSRAVHAPGRKPKSLHGMMLVARIQWRRRMDPAPAWLGAVVTLVVATSVAALASHNNANAAIGMSVLAAAALLAGGVFGRIDAELVRFLGHQPFPVLRILASSALATPCLIAIFTAVAGMVIGESPLIACSTAAGVGGLLAVFTIGSGLHALAGQPRFASFAALVDLAVGIVLLTAYAPLLWILAPARVVMLVQRARRLRWADL